jgi:hypothetical protein
VATEPPTGQALVRVLLRETGDRLAFVLRYDVEDWDSLYLGSAAKRFFYETSDDELDAMLEGFRQNGRANTRLARASDLGEFYCSLDLFGGLVLIHFFEPPDDGVIFGFDPAAASHLTDFVSLILPYVRTAGLDGLEEHPDWSTG